MYPLIKDGSLDAHLVELRGALLKRQQALFAALTYALPASHAPHSWTHVETLTMSSLASPLLPFCSGGGLNPFAGSLMYPLIKDGSLDAHLVELRATLRKRQQALSAALTKALPPDSTIEAEHGGYFVWVRVPGVDFTRLASVARAEFEVGYTPGMYLFLKTA